MSFIYPMPIAYNYIYRLAMVYNIYSLSIAFQLLHVHRVFIPCLHMILLSCMLSGRWCCPSPSSLLHLGRKCAASNYPTCQWERSPLEPPSTTAKSTSAQRTMMKVVKTCAVFLSTPLMSTSGAHSLSNSVVQPLQ